MTARPRLAGPGRLDGAPDRTRQGARGHRAAEGQSLVEFALIVPIFMLLLLGMLEFGFAFTADQTLAYATREGARTGAALANGGGILGCGAGQSPNAASVDPLIVAAVERVLTSPGSPVGVHLDRIPTIRIYLANSDGSESASADVWTYRAGAGPVVDGKAIDYVLTSTGWAACSRLNGVAADGLGVSLTYSYQFQTPYGAILGYFGAGGLTSLDIGDRTVMNLNPTQ